MLPEGNLQAASLQQVRTAEEISSVGSSAATPPHGGNVSPGARSSTRSRSWVAIRRCGGSSAACAPGGAVIGGQAPSRLSRNEDVRLHGSTVAMAAAPSFSPPPRKPVRRPLLQGPSPPSARLFRHPLPTLRELRKALVQRARPRRRTRWDETAGPQSPWKTNRSAGRSSPGGLFDSTVPPNDHRSADGSMKPVRRASGGFPPPFGPARGQALTVLPPKGDCLQGPRPSG